MAQSAPLPQARASTDPRIGTVSSRVAGPSGVRAQALAIDGSLVDDFRLGGSRRVLHVHNAPSPGATASLAIGRVLAERAIDRFEPA